MKKFVFWVSSCIFIGIAIFFLNIKHNPVLIKKNTSHEEISVSITPGIRPVTHVSKSLFVPYWTMDDNLHDTTGYANIIYFGISPTKQGFASDEIGYKSINNFLKIVPSNSKRLLGIRMINTDDNRGILNDKNMQQKIIQQSIATAKEKGFDGVLLDFEISALGFDSVTNTISNFEDLFADTAKSEGLPFYTAIYGDTFARFRPFDVKNIASHADGIMIMAYDFHKANGNPGPNFPLKDNQDEGYDFQTMISDFLQEVPPQKITVVFGLFGYDWEVNNKGTTVGQAVPLSDFKITQQFLNACHFTDCVVYRDAISTETKITYTDTTNHHHIVWFDDISSVAKKTTFLQSKGIGSIAYWAYSYFAY